MTADDSQTLTLSAGFSTSVVPSLLSIALFALDIAPMENKAFLEGLLSRALPETALLKDVGEPVMPALQSSSQNCVVDSQEVR